MAKAPKPARIAEQIQTLLTQIAEGELSDHEKRKRRKELDSLFEQLREARAKLDPVREPGTMFNPTDPNLVGRFIGVSLVAQDRHKLTEVKPFYGSGVYAIYYDGPFPVYTPLVGTEHPIYVGKADPENHNAKTAIQQGRKLAGRLQDHVKLSLSKATNLDLADFTCRYLVVQSGWQIPAEKYLINLFQPVWNDETKICWGIGKHGDSAKKRSNDRSPWDTLHEGRAWAASELLADARPKERIEKDISEHLAANTIYKDANQILEHFFEELRQK